MEHDPKTEANKLWADLGSKDKRNLAIRNQRYMDEWLGGLSQATRAELLTMCDKYELDWRSRVGVS